MNNPFERYGLDPREGVEAITRRLKELAEDAKSDTERAEIRAAWEELTLHPARRLRAALFAHPETRPPLAGPPPRTRVRVVATELGLRDIAPRPSVERALSLSEQERARAEDQTSSAPSFVDDPLV